MADRDVLLAVGDASLGGDLDEALDDILSDAVRSGVSWLDRALAPVLRRPGKRLRLRLVLHAARCGPGTDLTATLPCAAAVELLHRGSLVHDDLMDEAPFRGDEVSTVQRSGVSGAVLVGDYLVAVAGRLVAQVGAPAALVWQEAYRDMCLGQAREMAHRHRVTSPGEYLATIRGKTGAPIRAAVQLGGLCAGLPDAGVHALAEFGERFGVLLQLIDDVLDVVSTATLCGKPVQHDITQGVYTLPVMFATGAWAGDAGHPRLPRQGGLGLGPDLAPAQLAAVYDSVRARGLRPAVAVAADWATGAASALTVLPPSPARQWLADLPGRYLREQLTTRVAPAYRHLIELT